MELNTPWKIKIVPHEKGHVFFKERNHLPTINFPMMNVVSGGIFCLLSLVIFYIVGYLFYQNIIRIIDGEQEKFTVDFMNARSC